MDNVRNSYWLTSATAHWLLQRVTAILLIPLSFKLLIFLSLCLNAPFQQTSSWLNATFNMFCILSWFIITFYHAAMGLQVVIEDYVADRSLQTLLIKAVNLSFLSLAVISIILILNIS